MKSGTIITGWRIHSRHFGMIVEDRTFNIIRTDQRGFSPSGEWHALAVWDRYHRHFFAGTIADEFDALAKLSPDALRFKNGKPKYFLGDFDHGTCRVQTDGIIAVHKGRFQYREMYDYFTWEDLPEAVRESQ